MKHLFSGYSKTVVSHCRGCIFQGFLSLQKVGQTSLEIDLKWPQNPLKSGSEGSPKRSLKLQRKIKDCPLPGALCLGDPTTYPHQNLRQPRRPCLELGGVMWLDWRLAMSGGWISQIQPPRPWWNRGGRAWLDLVDPTTLNCLRAALEELTCEVLCVVGSERSNHAGFSTYGTGGQTGVQKLSI